MKKIIKALIAKILHKLCLFAAYKNIIPRDGFMDLFPLDEVETKYGIIKLYAPGTIIHWRSKTFFEKEPETLEWIDSFDSDAVFWDIGANVGLYSLYAAKKGLNVLAFEPVYQNTFILSRNVYINKLDDRIKSLPLALSDKSKIDYIFLQHMQIGEAENSFGTDVDWRRKKYDTLYRQGAAGFSTDDLIQFFSLEVPAYIKIDVDGLEYEIITGMDKTLNRPELKEILLELCVDDPRYNKLLETLSSKGFILKEKRHAPLFENSEYKNVYNHIFCRASS